MIIIITRPEYFASEATIINCMLHLGIPRIHIRKPDSNANSFEQLIKQIEPQYYSRLVLHDHHTLAQKYNLGGIHLNSRNPHPLSHFTGTLSRSCHMIDELCLCSLHHSYCSLSPIFDSVSKQGYNAAFTDEQLKQAQTNGIINHRTYALGGVTLNNLPLVAHYGFGGAMLLGEPWQMAANPHFEDYIQQLVQADSLFLK